jgi:phosphoglycerate dehydrogenase-like enzyme
VYEQLLANGVRLSNSSGTAATPIAQSAIGGMLILSRGFLHWLDAQRQHAWSPHCGPRIPVDLQDQTLLVLGVGAIGNEIARLARALGLHVIGVRRRPVTPQDHVDEMHPPGDLDVLLPRAHWLTIACPLTPQTHGLLDARRLAMLPPGAHVINVARGEIIDAAALIATLSSGHLGGAYLDVFAQEPLSTASPLWDMPNVLISPHDSAASAGNGSRADHLFLNNLKRWAQAEPLHNEITQV